MKKLIILLLLFVTSVANAQEVKQPDTYNYKAALEAIKNDDLKKGMEYLDEELKENPKNGYAIAWKGWVYAQYGNNGMAMEYINKCFKLVPKKDKNFLASMYAIRGDVYRVMADTVSALNDYMFAYKLCTDNGTEYMYKHIKLLNEQDKYTEIDKDLAMLANTEKNNAVYYTYIGRNEYNKGNDDKALENYNYSLKLNSDYSSAYSFRALLYLKEKKFREAASDIIEAMDRDATSMDWNLMREVADSSFNTMKVLLEAKTIKEPDNHFWFYCLANICDNTEKWQMAIDNYNKAIEKCGYDQTVLTKANANKADCEMQLGRYNAALLSINKSIESDSTRLSNYATRSDIYFNLGNVEAAIEDVNYGLSQDPETSFWYGKRAVLRMYSKRYLNAIDDLNSAVVLSPKSSYYLQHRGVAHYLSGDNKKAVDDFNAALALEGCPDGIKAFCYAYLGRKLEARAVLDTCYKVSDKGDCYDLACTYSVMGETDKALDFLEKSFGLGFREFYHAEHDYDLMNIQGLPRFKKLITEYKKKAEEENNMVAELSTSADKMPSSTADNYVVTEVPFTKDSGIYKVKCKINDLPLHFYFDTGAADVTISSVEATFMLKNGYLSKADLKGSQYYGTASGEISEGTTVILRKVDFGGLELKNVKASVVHSQSAPLLLGQTVLSNLGKIEIDYEKSVLRFKSQKQTK